MDILGARNAQALLDAYAVECLLPGSEPQTAIYEAMERAGVLACFGAYTGDELVGFITVLTSVMPHHGKRVATTESLYVEPSHRDSGAGDALLTAAKEFASESGCIVLLHTARVDSALETILSHRSGCIRSHAVFSEWL
jgi:GNAT superfamily N-acetyltransferase